MVSQFPMQYHQHQYRTAPLTVDTHHAQEYFKQEDTGALDDSILDNSAVDSGLELSPPMADSRRESFAGMPGHSLFSPQSVDMQSVPSNNPFENQPTSFVNLDHAQPGPFMVPGSSWPMATSNSGSGTPVQHFDHGLASMTAHNPFSSHGNIFSGLATGNPSMPTSPQSNWLAGQGSNKRTRPESPALRGHNDLRRGDGIRKKNARFDIPADRNLHNIDSLIAMSTDENEIKELKQQKRLLRNRQAALDSRQRKKLHTERLEEEKKDFTQLYQGIAEQNDQLRKDIEELQRDKQTYLQFVESTNLDKEEMIRAHTLETAELRKKVGVLTEHIQQLERDSRITAVAQSNVYSSGFGGFEDMNIPGSWDAGHFIHDYPVEPEQETKPSMALVSSKKSEPQPASSTDKNSPPSGLLFMLFLVGAFVLSNRTPQPLPPVSDDVRAASASLLETVLKDAGVAQGSDSVQPLAPQPSGATSWSDPSTSMPTAADSTQQSTLVEFSDSLTQPTQEQTNEQIFSLSAAQYNGVNDQDFLQNAPPKSMSQGRRNLADALAAMRMTNKHDGAAEVYTRSLLWDQIPSDVVRNFAKMVAECNSAPNAQQCDTATKT